MRAGDARARGIMQRGQNFAGMASGLGQMVGQEMLQSPIRKQQQEAQDLNRRLGEQRLDMGEQRMEDMKAARAEKEQIKARRQRYISILSENFGDPVGTMKSLKDEGMVEEMNAEYQKMLTLREQKAKTDTAEWKNQETQARLASETIQGLLRLEGPARDEQYPIARSRILSILPEMEDLLPESPDELTYETLGDTATMIRTAADQMDMDSAEFKKVENARKRQEGMDKKAEDTFDKAIEKLSKVSKGFWDGEVKHQRKRIEKHSPDRLEQFDALTSAGHSKDTKAALKEWAGEGKDFTGEYGNYRKDAEERGETPMDPLEFARAMTKARKTEEVDEKDPLKPSEALAVLRYVDSMAKYRKESEVEYFDIPLEQLRQDIASEKGINLGRLEALSVGKETAVLDFSSMSDEELRSLGEKKGELTKEQLEAAAQEWDRRFKQ